MPNWVDNSLAINKKYKDILIDEHNNLDFNKLIPMPESLDITSGGNQTTAIAVYLFKERNQEEKIKDLYKISNMKNDINFPKTLDEFADYLEAKYTAEAQRLLEKSKNKEGFHQFDQSMLEEYQKYPTLAKLGEVYVTNEEKYGSQTWYDWRLQNWSCKWNASQTSVEENGDLLEIYFSTPWCTPYKWLEALSEVAPFYLEWVEEQGYHGECYAEEKGCLKENELDFIYFDYGYDEDDEDYQEPNEEEVITFYERREDVLTWESNFHNEIEPEI